jgi:hypothetical protein
MHTVFSPYHNVPIIEGDNFPVYANSITIVLEPGAGEYRAIANDLQEIG